jgi:predicted GNAT family N-acyltransferase
MTIQVEKTQDLTDCHALRVEVFVVEQNVSADEEFDDLDGVSEHFIARDNGRPVGTARVFEVGTTGKIGRVCVVKSHRGTGLGARLIEASLNELKVRPGLTQVKLGAQNHAIEFYARFGFEVIGDEYLDAGIPHHDMVLTL